MSRFTLVSTDKEYEQRIQQATASLNGDVQWFSPDVLASGPEGLLRSTVGEYPDVVVLGPGVDREGGLKFATMMDLQYQDISVLMVGEPSPDLVMSAMRAGVRDLISEDMDASAIRVLLERASHASASRRRGPMTPTNDSEAQSGQVIAVLSPKGGVGKTTIATNLAVALGRIAPMGVVVVDLDVQFGDVASGLQLEPEHTLTDAVQGAGPHDSMVLKAFLSVHPANFYALCAPRSPVEADQIGPEQVSQVLRQLSRVFPFVIVDTAPGLDDFCLAALDQATDAVWVCGMDVPSIRGLRMGLTVLHDLDLVPQRRHVVLNAADRYSGLSVQDVEATVGVPVDVIVPRSKGVPWSTNKGVPLLQEGAKDPAAKGLQSLASRLDPAFAGKPQRKLHRRVVVS